MKKITLYSDGSSLGNPGVGGWCSILQYKNVEKIISGAESNTTNNRMELTAVIEALKILKEPCEVELYSDSQYVVHGINQWLGSWIKKDFIKVKNPDLWRQYVELSKIHNIKGIWVKGHNGITKNEECDKIAKQAANIKRDNLNSKVE